MMAKVNVIKSLSAVMARPRFVRVSHLVCAFYT
jgi:hypothetical protein